MFRFLLFFLSVCSVISPLVGQDVQYENLVIEKLDITVENPPAGSPFNTALIRSKIKTQVGDVFSQSTFDTDLKALAQDYNRVDPFVEIKDGKAFITLKIWLKPHIRTIRFEGNSSGFDSVTLLREIGISPGDLFDRLAFAKAFHKLKAYYVKNGYFEASLDYTANLDSIANEVDITVLIQEGRSGKIQRIVFHGLTPQEESDILDLMVTKTWNFFLSWFTEDGIFKEDAMQYDQNQIINYLQNLGYADAKVSIEIKEARANRIEIHIKADKGEIYTFGKIAIEGPILYSDDEIKPCILIHEGECYSPEKLRQTVTNIMDLYGTSGYIDAIVNFEPVLQSDCPKYDIRFMVEQGEQYRVGLIKIFGNCRTQNRVILHESLLIPGEVFNTVKLKRTEERLRNIGYFKAVNVYAVRSEDSDSLGCNYRDVYIELEEISTGNISAFGGFSNVESIFGGFNVTEKNFNIAGLPYVFRDGMSVLRGGGEYAHITATIGAKSRSYGFSWAKPFFMDTPWVVGFDVEKANVRYISKDYVIDAWGFMLHAKYPINCYTRFSWHYRLRDTDVHVRNDADQRSPQLKEESKNSGLISATGVSLTYDSTDCIGKPSCGFRSRIEAEYAGVGGDHYFLGVGYLNSWYVPVGEKGVFKTRVDMKYLLPIFGTKYETMPIDERLFLGGDNGVRGYRPFAIGPKFEGTNDPRGGLSSNLFSLEYCYRYSPKLEGFVFFDAGSLSKHEFSLFNFRTSAGFGLRCTFFASGPPFTVGFGFPINPKSRSEVRRFFFSMGGNF